VSNKKLRILIGVLCIAGLLAVFLFQREDLTVYFGLSLKPLHRFLFNRTVRFLLNDLFAIGLIYALFEDRKYVIFSCFIQLIGMVFFLFPYFVLKLYFPTYNGPLISYLHRLILNPILIILLIPAFYYQRQQRGRAK